MTLEAGKFFLKHKRQRKHKVKRQATEQGKTFEIQITDKEYKEHLNYNNNKRQII